MRYFSALTFAAVFGISTESALGQNVSLLATKQPDQLSVTQIAVPGGASATVDSTSSGAEPILGFQVWNEDKHTFVGAFFTFAPPRTVSGTQKDFGSMVLNPPAQGTSFYVSGSQAHPRFGEKVLVGYAGRAGITSTHWQAMVGGSSQVHDGFVAYFSPAVLLSTKTYRTNTETKTVEKTDPTGLRTIEVQKQTPNEYQVGLEIGPTFRVIGGDVAQKDAFRADPGVLGSDAKHILGLDLTFFVRLNAFQPYVRISYVGKQEDKQIVGLTGWQAYFSVNVLSAIFQTQAQQ